MEGLATFLVLIFMIGFIISVVGLVISIFKRNFRFTKKHMGLAILVCFIGFIASMIMFAHFETDETKARVAQQNAQKEADKQAKEEEKKQKETDNQKENETESEEVKTENTQEYTLEETDKSNNVDTTAQGNLKNEEISLDEIKEIIKGDVGQGEQITNTSFDGKTIVIDIDLGTPPNNIKPKDLASNRYSSISDDLLEYNFWNVLTVNFKNVGTVTLNADEASSNSWGKYFEGNLIEKQLK